MTEEHDDTRAEMERQAGVAAARGAMRELVQGQNTNASVADVFQALEILLAELDLRDLEEETRISRGPQMVGYMLDHLRDLTDIVAGYRNQLVQSGFDSDPAQAMAMQIHSYMLVSGVYRPFGGAGQQPHFELVSAEPGEQDGVEGVQILLAETERSPGYTATNSPPDAPAETWCQPGHSGFEGCVHGPDADVPWGEHTLARHCDMGEHCTAMDPTCNADRRNDDHPATCHHCGATL